MNKDEFINELKKININISVDTLSKLDIYYHLLVEENQKYNLTSITEEKEVYLKHFYDSLTLSKIVKLNMKRERLHSRLSDAVLIVELNNAYGNEDSNKKLVNDCFHTMSDVNIKQRMIRESISKINNTISRINTNKYRLINNNRIIKP